MQTSPAKHHGSTASFGRLNVSSGYLTSPLSRLVSEHSNDSVLANQAIIPDSLVIDSNPPVVYFPPEDGVDDDDNVDGIYGTSQGGNLTWAQMRDKSQNTKVQSATDVSAQTRSSHTNEKAPVSNAAKNGRNQIKPTAGATRKSKQLLPVSLHNQIPTSHTVNDDQFHISRGLNSATAALKRLRGSKVAARNGIDDDDTAAATDGIAVPPTQKPPDRRPGGKQVTAASANRKVKRDGQSNPGLLNTNPKTSTDKGHQPLAHPARLQQDKGKREVDQDESAEEDWEVPLDDAPLPQKQLNGKSAAKTPKSAKPKSQKGTFEAPLKRPTNPSSTRGKKAPPDKLRFVNTRPTAAKASTKAQTADDEEYRAPQNKGPAPARRTTRSHAKMTEEQPTNSKAPQMVAAKIKQPATRNPTKAMSSAKISTPAAMTPGILVKAVQDFEKKNIPLTSDEDDVSQDEDAEDEVPDDCGNRLSNNNTMVFESGPSDGRRLHPQIEEPRRSHDQTHDRKGPMTSPQVASSPPGAEDVGSRSSGRPDIALPNDHAARKPNHIAFSGKGPLNQGTSSGKIRSRQAVLPAATRPDDGAPKTPQPFLFVVQSNVQHTTSNAAADSVSADPYPEPYLQDMLPKGASDVTLNRSGKNMMQRPTDGVKETFVESDNSGASSPPLSTEITRSKVTSLSYTTATDMALAFEGLPDISIPTSKLQERTTKSRIGDLHTIVPHFGPMTEHPGLKRPIDSLSYRSSKRRKTHPAESHETAFAQDDSQHSPPLDKRQARNASQTSTKVDMYGSPHLGSVGLSGHKAIDDLQQQLGSNAISPDDSDEYIAHFQPLDLLSSLRKQSSNAENASDLTKTAKTNIDNSPQAAPSKILSVQSRAVMVSGEQAAEEALASADENETEDHPEPKRSAILLEELRCDPVLALAPAHRTGEKGKIRDSRGVQRPEHVPDIPPQANKHLDIMEALREVPKLAEKAEANVQPHHDAGPEIPQPKERTPITDQLQTDPALIHGAKEKMQASRLLERRGTARARAMAPVQAEAGAQVMARTQAMKKTIDESEDDPDKTLVDETNNQRYDRDYSCSSDSESRLDDELSSCGQLEDDRAAWLASLHPHQANLLDSLINVSHRLVRHLVEKETAITDIITDYCRDGHRLIEELEAGHKTEYETFANHVTTAKTELINELHATEKTTQKSWKDVEASRARLARLMRSDGNGTVQAQLDSLIRRYG